MLGVSLARSVALFGWWLRGRRGALRDETVYGGAELCEHLPIKCDVHRGFSVLNANLKTGQIVAEDEVLEAARSYGWRSQFKVFTDNTPLGTREQ